MKKIVAILCSILASSLAQAGTIQGKISLNGTPPAPVRVKMSSDPSCVSSGVPVFESKVISTDGGLGNAFIYVKNFSGPSPKATSPIILDQKNCVFTPRVVGIQVGQSLTILNSDPTLHNVHSLPTTNVQFNLGMPVQNMKITKTFDKPEIGIRLKCDVHPWMAAWINVVTNPYFSVSASDGTYEIKNVPAGSYHLGLWHEKLGEQELNVVVPTAGTASANFTVTLK